MAMEGRSGGHHMGALAAARAARPPLAPHARAPAPNQYSLPISALYNFYGSLNENAHYSNSLIFKRRFYLTSLDGVEFLTNVII